MRDPLAKSRYHSRDKGIPHYRNLTALPEEAFYTIQAKYLGPRARAGAPPWRFPRQRVAQTLRRVSEKSKD